MSWVRFLSGTQIFSLCHARGNISSLSNERCLRMFCRVIPEVRENLRIKFWQNILTIHFSPSNTFLVAAVVFLFKAILSPRLLFIIFFLNATVCLSSFQVLAVTPQPVKLSSSRFTTKMDTILSNWLSIEMFNMPCTAVQITDPGLVAERPSSYRTTL